MTEKIKVGPHDDFLLALIKADADAQQHPNYSRQIPSKMNMAVERTVGTAYIRFSAVDADILKEMPEKVKGQFATVPDEQMAYVDLCVSDDPLHIKAWLRQNELDPRLGRWSYFECKIDRNELKSNPHSQASVAFIDQLRLINTYKKFMLESPESWIKKI